MARRTSRRRTSRNPRCPSCGGVSHPASGSVLPSGEVVCGPCVRRFWSWASEHGKKTYRVGKKGKGSKYIAFPTGITKKNARERGDCLKCSGTGNIPRFGHYAQGVCFDCGGTGNARAGGGRGPSLPPMTQASVEERIKSLVWELRTMWRNFQIHRREGEESLDEMFYSWSADEEEGKRQRGQDDSAPTEAKGKAYWIRIAQAALDDLRKLGATEKADEIAKQFQTRLRIPVKNTRTSRRRTSRRNPKGVRPAVGSVWIDDRGNRVVVTKVSPRGVSYRIEDSGREWSGDIFHEWDLKLAPAQMELPGVKRGRHPALRPRVVHRNAGRRTSRR